LPQQNNTLWCPPPPFVQTTALEVFAFHFQRSLIIDVGTTPGSHLSPHYLTWIPCLPNSCFGGANKMEATRWQFRTIRRLGKNIQPLFSLCIYIPIRQTSLKRCGCLFWRAGFRVLLWHCSRTRINCTALLQEIKWITPLESPNTVATTLAYLLTSHSTTFLVKVTSLVFTLYWEVCFLE
jgi:hypothetical protein